MKVLFINNDYKRYTGGVSKYLHGLYSGLEERGVDIVLMYGENGNLSIDRARREYCIPGISKFRAKEDSALTDRALRIIKSENPDIVHLQVEENFALDRRIQKLKPLVKTEHTYGSCCPCGGKYFYYPPSACGRPFGPVCYLNYFIRRCWGTRNPFVFYNFCRASSTGMIFLKSLRKIIVTSESVKGCFLKNGFSDRQIEVLPCFAELSDLSETKGGNVILFVGRIMKEKGLHYLIKALKFVKVPFRLVVVGDGMQMQSSKRLARVLIPRANIEFVGWQDNPQDYYRSASVVAVPSIWPEPFGMVGIEAMSYAKPVVAFDVGGIPEWLENGKTGFLIKPYEIKGMAAKLEFLLNNPGLASAMGKEGRNRVGLVFSKDNHIDRLLNIYDDVIKNKGLSNRG